jgi:hypothetical protein
MDELTKNKIRVKNFICNFLLVELDSLHFFIVLQQKQNLGKTVLKNCPNFKKKDQSKINEKRKRPD